MTNMTTPHQAQQGEWTLTAPDGRQWKADSPLKCCSIENAERVPPEVRLQRIMDGANAWGEGAIWLVADGRHVIVRIEREGKWLDVIREFGGETLPPFSHIVEVAGIEAHLKGGNHV